MKITLNASVALGGGWDEKRVYKEINIETEHTDDPQLPWAQICAGLVQATIRERLAADDSEEENEA